MSGREKERAARAWVARLTNAFPRLALRSVLIAALWTSLATDALAHAGAAGPADGTTSSNRGGFRPAGPDSVCFQREARGSPRGHSYSIVDADTGEWLGSASHLCSPFLYDSTNSMYFAAASHEIEGPRGIRRIALDSEPICVWFEAGGARVMMEAPGAPALAEDVAIDSSADLAFFRVPSRSLHRIGCLSLPIGDGLALPAARDPESAIGLTWRSLAIEAVDPATRLSTRREFRGRIARTMTEGLPGREGTGPLVIAIGERGFAGNSGGAIVEVEPERIAGFGSRSKLVGILLAYDSGSRGRSMALLNADVVRDRLFAYVTGRGHGFSQLPARAREREIDGGVEYLNSAGAPVAAHFRNGRFGFLSAGAASRFLDARGPGRLGDGGSGRFPSGRGPGRLGDGGPGRLGDGGERAGVARWASGIEIYAFPGWRWLSIADAWSELEPFPLGARGLLESRSAPSGVFENAAGALFATSSETPLPPLIEESLGGGAGCRVVDASTGAADGDDPRPASAVLCARRSRQETTVAIAPLVGRSRSAVARGVYVVSLRKACAPDDSPCPLRLSARAIDARPADPATLERLAFSEASAPGVDLRRDGLRTFWRADGGACLHLEKTAGFRISLGSCASPGAWIAGPL